MILYNCDKCNKPISLNEAHITINYNVEMKKHNPVILKDEVNVAHSQLVLVLCGKCGNQHYANNVADALQLKKTVYQEIPPEKMPAAKELSKKQKTD